MLSGEEEGKQNHHFPCKYDFDRFQKKLMTKMALTSIAARWMSAKTVIYIGLFAHSSLISW